MPISLMFIDSNPAHHKQVDLQIKHSTIQLTYQCCLNAFDALCYLLDYSDTNTLPDLILLDLDMPFLSGWETMEYIETMLPRLAKPIDIIILTSSINQADRERALNYDCVKGFVNKPFTTAMLRDILHSPFVSLNNKLEPLWQGISLSEIEGLL